MSLWFEIRSWAFPSLYLHKSFEELAILTQKGDENAFLTIYERLKNPIYNYTYNLVSQDKEIAQDITQETFLKALKNIEQYKKDFKFSTWIWTIARNTAFDHMRKVGLSDNYVDDEKLKTAFENTSVCSLTSLEKQFHLKEIKMYIEECLNKLPQQFKESLIMQLFAQMSYHEMTLALAINENTLKSNLLRAKKAMATCLEHKEIGASNE
tara:strand:+ start:48489 stop:49118 length:630 start_codon:yes stop_codon:yes gene_type:complete